MKKLLLAIVLVLSCHGCSSQKIVDISHHLYKIKKNNSYLYLLGSIDVGKEFDQLDNSTENAYQDSDIIVTELLLDNLDKTNYLHKMPIKDVCKQETLDKLMDNINKYSTNLIYFNSDRMSGYNPVVISSTLRTAIFQDLGYSSQYGIDTYFIKRGKEDKKAFDELVSKAFQENFVLEISRQFGNDMILQTAHYDENLKIQKELVDIYYHSKKEEINNHCYRIDYNDITNDNKNNQIMQKIDKYLQDDKIEFILADTKLVDGKQGLIELLKKNNEYNVIEY